MSMPLINYLGSRKARVIGSAKKASARIASFIRPGLTVLLYHRVTRLSGDPQMLAVTPERFEEQLKFLKKSGKLLTVGQFDGILKTGKRFPKSVMITFDDGYADNFTEALPILERLSIPAIFFISTAHLNTKKEFWWDNLERIFLLGADTPNRLSVAAGNKTEDMPTGTQTEKVFAYRKFHKILKPLLAEVREETVRKMLAWANLPEDGRETHRSMTNEEVKRLSQSPFARIGAHTHNHVALKTLSKNEQLKEITESKRILENITGKTVGYFSYPFGGKNDYSGETAKLCEQTGFSAAFANTPGVVRKSTNRFRLPRIIVRNWDAKEFAKNI